MSRINKLITKLCPKGVEFKSIGEIADCYGGATPASGMSAYWENGTIPWMSSGEVNKGTVHVTDKQITQAAYDSCSTKMVPSNAVVIALAGQGKTRGMAARTRLALCTNQSLCSVVCKESMSSDFLYHYLQTQYHQLRSVSSGAGARGGLNLQMIRVYRIPVPPLEIQREIVKVLDTFTELEAKLEAELGARQKQYRHYRDSLLSFEDSTKREGVRWVTLKEVGEFTRGRRFTNDDFVESGIPCIHYGEVYTHYGLSATETKSFVRPELAPSLRMAKTGDLIIAGTGENVEDIGKAVAWLGKSEVAVHDDCYIFKHSLNPKYAAHFFQSSRFNEQKVKYSAGAKMIRIQSEGLRKIHVPVPTLEEQARIVAILDKFDALTNDPSTGLPAEIAARRQQYEHCRDRLLTFKEAA
ncbi:MAG: restriction endonuclease subunit S [Elusimicrobiota bacterium]|nr:restriction endonuclease subunit S [Elusimicrobiota bacterium]